MTLEHISEVVAIERACFSDPWSVANFCELLEEPSTAWITLSHKQVVGYIVILRFLDAIHLLNIAVREDVRHCGVGRQLLNFILKIACVGGYRIIILEVRVSNHSAIEFYRKAGFRQNCQQTAYYDDGENALIMEYPISEGCAR